VRTTITATDRVPAFAICARCGIRRHLASCRLCGLLVCSSCRGVRECAVCQGERLASARRSQRRARLRDLGRRAAVVALVAASGVTGLGAAFLPDGPLAAAAFEATPVELRMVTLPSAPVTFETAAAPWHQPLSFHCYDAGQGVTCCVVSPRD
jgi:hypothetical protein